jgi:hypothetical protein
MQAPSIQGEILSREALSEPLEDQLYGLYDAHYEGGSRERFGADLREKEWVLLLREPGGAPVGFSTQALMDVEVEGRPVRALFSGDTVIHREFWGSQELTRTWLRFAGAQLARCEDRPFYWFLISKGHRTYQYLPLFFHEFYPRYDAPTPPFERRLIETLATKRFPEHFRPESGLIEWRGEHDRLRPELDGCHRRLRSPHVRFFLSRNPDYHTGTDLVCVAEIHPENLRGWVRQDLESAIAEGRNGDRRA